MALNKSQIRDAIEFQLKDSSNQTWVTEEIDAAIERVVREVSKAEPKLEYTYLPIDQYTRFVNINSLTGLINIIANRVEWPYGASSPNFRNYTEKGNRLELRLRTVPTITEDTLDGTVTFTKDSSTVSGSSTSFKSVLQDGYFIRVSSGTHWYRIAKVVSDTELTLENSFEEDTVNDDENTVYRDGEGCVCVCWGKPYSLTESASDIPPELEEIVITGGVAHCLAAEAVDTTDMVNIGENAANLYLQNTRKEIAIYLEALAGLGRPEDDMEAIYPID